MLQTAPTQTGIYNDHLRRLELILAEQPELEAAMREVVASGSPVRLKTVPKFKLQGIGLVKLQGDEVTPSCELYRQYFQ